MNKEKYEEALFHIECDIKDCSGDALDEDGACICCMYPCWKMVAKELIEKQLEVF